MDYVKFDLENMSLQDTIAGITDFESSDLIFQYPGQVHQSSPGQVARLLWPLLFCVFTVQGAQPLE